MLTLNTQKGNPMKIQAFKKDNKTLILTTLEQFKVVDFPEKGRMFTITSENKQIILDFVQNNKSLSQIAREKGVRRCAIDERVARIFKRIRIYATRNLSQEEKEYFKNLYY